MAVKSHAKYFPLYDYLRREEADTLSLTFTEIERLIDDALPPTARTRRAFWSNRKVGAHQAAAWMESGYHVIEVDIETERVTFGRPVIRYEVRREGDEVWWTGSMVRALRAHLGMNQAGLAELLGVRQQTVSEWETSVYAPTRARSKHLSMVAERAGFPYEKGEHESVS
jgi:hypothetical protein